MINKGYAPYTRHMSYGYRYFDPLDVYQWVGQSIYSNVRLIRATRHPQGYFTSVWDVIWEGKKQQILLKESGRTHMYSIDWPMRSLEYIMANEKSQAVRDVVKKLYKKAMPKNVLSHAQKSILERVLWNHERGQNLTDSILSGGYGNKEFYASYQRGAITISINNQQVAEYSLNHVADAIVQQIQSQQLVLF